jgi:ribosome-associated protein
MKPVPPSSLQPENPPPVSRGLRVGPGVHVHESLLRFTFSSSSGPGGQNVNKRATKATLRIALSDLPLEDDALARLARLATQLTDAGELVIIADEYRSQERNKDACLDRLKSLIAAALVRPKVRRKTKPTFGSKTRRLTDKKRQGERKRGRSSRGDGE